MVVRWRTLRIVDGRLVPYIFWKVAVRLKPQPDPLSDASAESACDIVPPSTSFPFEQAPVGRKRPEAAEGDSLVEERRATAFEPRTRMASRRPHLSRPTCNQGRPLGTKRCRDETSPPRRVFRPSQPIAFDMAFATVKVCGGLVSTGFEVRTDDLRGDGVWSFLDKLPLVLGKSVGPSRTV